MYEHLASYAIDTIHFIYPENQGERREPRGTACHFALQPSLLKGQLLSWMWCFRLWKPAQYNTAASRGYAESTGDLERECQKQRSAKSFLWITTSFMLACVEILSFSIRTLSLVTVRFDSQKLDGFSTENAPVCARKDHCGLSLADAKVRGKLSVPSIIQERQAGDLFWHRHAFSWGETILLFF